jgi:hypothetical protein
MNGAVEITDLQMVGPGDALPNASALVLDRPGSAVTINRLKVSGFPGTAITIEGAASSTLSEIDLEDNGTGIGLTACSGPHHVAKQVRGWANGTWFRASAGVWSFHWAIGPVTEQAHVGAGHGRLLAMHGDAQVELSDVRMQDNGGGAWIAVTGAGPGSRIKGRAMHLGTGSRMLLVRPDAGITHPMPASSAEGMGFCWQPDATVGPLPADCGDQAGHPAVSDEGARSGGSSIAIGADQGPPLLAQQWGYNASGLFYVCTGADTSLQHRLDELQPRVLRFPGGTLANFYHPTGLGYGIRQQDINLVAGTPVYDNINGNYQLEQGLIAEGAISGNYIQDMIDLALATNSSVVYVANLFSGTVGEMVGAVQALVNAGVSVAGVELGNEAHLQAYQSRFGSVTNYLSVAQPFANALANNFPDIPIGLDGFPPGILKGAGPAGTQRAHDWNVACSNATFGDALIIHCYSRPDACNQAEATANFLCGAQFSQTYANDKLPQALSELASLGSKKIWITEWNIDGGYGHYGNSMAQALFYADMAFTMANEPKVTVSCYHELLAYQDGYNLVEKSGPLVQPQVNYWTSEMLADLQVAGNQPQAVTISGISGLRGYAFRAPDGMQHLYLINRSGTAMDLSAFQGTASNVAWTVMGGSDIAEGTGPNNVRAQGNMVPVSGTATSIANVQLPGYSIAHLKWMPAAENGPAWSTSFGGSEGCTLVAMIGASITQSIPGRCATIANGTITTQDKTSFPMDITVSKVVLNGVTFNDVSTGRWINSRLRFQGQPGRIRDAGTGQVLATVSAGVRYEQLVLDFGQPLPLQSLLGRMNIGRKTALMTIEGMKLFP